MILECNVIKSSFERLVSKFVVLPGSFLISIESVVFSIIL